jgi:hypothetical protein
LPGFRHVGGPEGWIFPGGNSQSNNDTANLHDLATSSR